jgi:hypothetical protein
MRLNDYSSLEEYAAGLFDGYMGLPMSTDKNSSESYLNGFKRAQHDQLTNPIDKRITIV